LCTAPQITATRCSTLYFTGAQESKAPVALRSHHFFIVFFFFFFVGAEEAKALVARMKEESKVSSDLITFSTHMEILAAAVKFGKVREMFVDG